VYNIDKVSLAGLIVVRIRRGKTMGLFGPSKKEREAETAAAVAAALAAQGTPRRGNAAVQEEIGLEKTVAEKVAKEINRFVFYPVKPVLEQLHQIKSAPTENKSIQNQAPQPIEQLAPMKAESKEGELPRVMPEQQSQKSQETDPYREPIE